MHLQGFGSIRSCLRKHYERIRVIMYFAMNLSLPVSHFVATRASRGLALEFNCSEAESLERGQKVSTKETCETPLSFEKNHAMSLFQPYRPRRPTRAENEKTEEQLQYKRERQGLKRKRERKQLEERSVNLSEQGRATQTDH